MPIRDTMQRKFTRLMVCGLIAIAGGAFALAIFAALGGF